MEPYLVASSISCVVGQRLARRLCDSCSQVAKIPRAALEPGAEGEIEVREPGSCARCGGTGYRGRTGLFEVMPVTRAIRDAILQRAPAETIANVAVEEGMRRLREDGMAKVAAGVTSVAEVTRVIGR
jgi:type IV pilus assembly protein PilB